MESIVRVEQAIQYDGTNGVAVAAAFPDSLSFSEEVVHATVGSEEDGILTVHYWEYSQSGYPADFLVNEGDWVIPGAYAGNSQTITTGAVRLDTLTNP
jgi:hypothetical protein